MEKPSDPQVRRSVFISYSRQDTAFARRVRDALESQGIFAWFDQAEIAPGVRDWEDAIRRAIQQSRALILIASPHSRQSPYVKDELALAQAYQLRVYPVWTMGDIWMEAIPLGWGHTQFLDARGASEPSAVQALIVALDVLLPSRRQRHLALPKRQQPAGDRTRRERSRRGRKRPCPWGRCSPPSAVIPTMCAR